MEYVTDLSFRKGGAFKMATVYEWRRSAGPGQPLEPVRVEAERSWSQVQTVPWAPARSAPLRPAQAGPRMGWHRQRPRLPRPQPGLPRRRAPLPGPRPTAHIPLAGCTARSSPRFYLLGLGAGVIVIRGHLLGNGLYCTRVTDSVTPGQVDIRTTSAR